MNTSDQTEGSEEILDLDEVPIYLQSPPEVVTSPPVVTRAQILPYVQLSWENFERLCVRLASLNGDVEHCRLYGNRGQRQQGIDVYARTKSSDKYRAYQCKRYSEFAAHDIRNAVKEFRKGKWFSRCSHFFLCTSASAVVTQFADEYERQRTNLQSDGIEFVMWDSEGISLELKDRPGIVDDFFGRAWVTEFCGPDSLGDEARMEGMRVTEFRRKMRQFYVALIEQLDPGIPIRPTQGRPAIPLEARYVLPDVQVESIVPDPTPMQVRPETSLGSINVGVQPFSASKSEERRSSSTRKYSQRQSVDTWLAQSKNSLLIGGPGSGKSSLLRYLALEILSDNPIDSRIGPWAKLLPVWIPFAFWTKQISEGRDCNLTECLRLWLSMWNQEGLWPLVKAALNDSRLLLLVDGLDEWTTIESGRIAANMLQVFLRTQTVTAITTTRPFGGISMDGADWRAAEIAPLTKHQQTDLCGKWFRAKAKEGSEYGLPHELFVDQQAKDFTDELLKSRDLEELAQVPLLLLSLISVHFRRGVLPTDRFSAYDQLIEYLIEEHPARRRAASLDATDSGYSPLRNHEVRLIFSFIAFATHSKTLISGDKVLQIVEEFLNSTEGLGLGLQKLQSRKLAEQFARIAEGSSGLIIKQGVDSRSFLHRSLQEFLASFYLSHLPLKVQQQMLRDQLFNPQWRETLLGLLWNTKRPDDVENLLEPILENSDIPTREIYRSELLAEIAFGPFRYPTPKVKDIVTSTFTRIQRHEWLPHRRRLLSHSLQGLMSARTRDFIRPKIAQWIFARARFRSWWANALEHWPPTSDTIALLFDLLNDDSFDVQKAAARILTGTSKDVAEKLLKEFRTTLDPFRQAAILKGLNTLPPMSDVEALIEFASLSACDALRMEAIRGRVIRAVHDSADLDDLLAMGNRRGSKFGLREDISALLKSGWSNVPQLKAACFDGINTLGPNDELERSIALDVLLDAFPGDLDVAHYAAEQITNEEHPFIASDGFTPWKLLASNFKDNTEIVEAIDKWGPTQRYREPEIAYAALVGRTPTMKQVLLKHLESHLPFWAADSLVEGWSLTDKEVHNELLRIAEGPAANASGIARHIPKLIVEHKQAYQRLRRLLTDPDTRWPKQVLDTLATMGLSNDEKKEVAEISMEMAGNVRYIDRSSFAGAIILGFKELQAVRSFAIQALNEREPPVDAAARAFGTDAEMRALIGPLISALPQGLRSVIVEHLAKRDDDQFSLGLLGEYDKEENAELKTQASIAYHRRLLALGLDTAVAISNLTTAIRAYGIDMDARRQAAFAGLVILKQLDVMLSQSETIGNDPTAITMTDFTRVNLTLARIVAENWQYIKTVFGNQVEKRLNKNGDLIDVWEALALVAVDIPKIHTELLEQFDQNEISAQSPEALSFLARIRPRSELLKSRCIAAIRSSSPDLSAWRHPDTLRVALSILEEQFENRQQIAIEIAENRHPSTDIVTALAALDPSHPFVTEICNRIKNNSPVTIGQYFAAGYARIKPENLVSMFSHDLEILDEYNFRDLADALVRRIRWDPEVRSVLINAISGDVDDIVKMNIWRLLNEAGRLTGEQAEMCLREIDSQIRAGMVKCGFDVVAGAIKGLPVSLLDIVSSHE